MEIENAIFEILLNQPIYMEYYSSRVFEKVGSIL